MNLALWLERAGKADPRWLDRLGSAGFPYACVEEVSVVGRPDPEWGEVVVAYGAGEAAAADLDALRLSRIARFKRPKHYVFVETLPKNNYGEVLKTALRVLDRGGAPS